MNWLHFTKKTSISSKEEVIITKIYNKDFELMNLKWLMSKNQTTYIYTITIGLRVLLLNNDGSKPQSYILNSDGMSLTVDFPLK